MKRVEFSCVGPVQPASTNAEARGGESGLHAASEARSSRTRRGPAGVLLAGLLAGAVLMGCSEAPMGLSRAQIEVIPAATAKVRVSQAPAHIVASEGSDDYREPLKYMGQSAVQ